MDSNEQPEAPGTTFHAPAERAPADAVGTQARMVADQPLLCAVLDALPDGVLLLNAQRQILFANEAARLLLGGGPGEALLGLRPGEALHCTHAEEGPGGCGTSESCRWCGAVNAILDSQRTGTKASRNGWLSCDCTAGPRALDVAILASPLELDGRSLTLLTLRDREAESRRAVLERVFFHDVLNLAGALRGLVRVLADNPQEVSRGLLNRLGHISDRIVAAIREQRDLTAAERGELEPQLGPVPVAAVLTELESLYASHPVAAGRTVRWRRVAPADLCVRADRGLLLRVLGNLLKNALEATPVGGAVTVTAEAAADGRVRFRVHNPGHMPLDVQAQVFQRSFSTKGGTGRGLGTFGAKLLTERYLGGRIGFTSTPGEGTTFTVTLVAAVAEPRRTPEGADRANRLAGLSVLLAEDDPDCRWLTRRVLESAGARVTEVGDGAGVLAAVERGEACHLILLDVEMPLLDGLTTARTLRARGFRGPILALTARGGGARDAARAAGCDGCLDKSLEPRDLVAAVAQQVGHLCPAGEPR